MKNLFFLFVSIYLSLTSLSAQDIIFTFNAKDASNTIDSIKATKVESGETAFVEGLNTINLSSFATGTKLIPTNLEEISVYPNPFENLTQLKFYLSQDENIKISLINAAGQIVAEERRFITSGIHRFNISTKNSGLHILNVAGNQNKLTQKIISTKNNSFPNKIEYIGSSSKLKKEKSAKIEGGDLIHFFVYSGDNITKIADSPTESKTYEVEFHECKDADGNTYPIVQIGNQWWMAENNAYLPEVFPTSDFSKEKRYYVYGYNGTNESIAKLDANYNNYGVLYNWSAAKESCPDGWHLPTKEEWSKLYNLVGGNNISGYKLKSNSGWNDSGNGSNEYGFEALPSGIFAWDGNQPVQLNYTGMGNYGAFWSGTSLNNDATYTGFSYISESGFFEETEFLEYGFSVRCVKKDDTNPIVEKRPTQEEYLQVIQKLESEEKAMYFTNMLKNANFQFDDSSKLTVIVIVDNPYRLQGEIIQEPFLLNHIIKGVYHTEDFNDGTELTAISGNKITINDNGSVILLNRSTLLSTGETEVNGNIIHYVYSPIFCTELEIENYTDRTFSLFADYIEYSNVFDAVLTDESTAFNSSWTAIDNYTFNSGDEKIEKLWFDAFHILNRAIDVPSTQETITANIGKNYLIHSIIYSILFNYFGGLPILNEPSEILDQYPRETEYMKEYLVDRLLQISTNTTEMEIISTVNSLLVRLYFMASDEDFEYVKAIPLCEDIIENPSYVLEPNKQNIYNYINNQENIFAVENPKKISSELSSQINFLPVFRLSETYLILVYCLTEYGDMGKAWNIINQYQTAKGLQVSGIESPNELKSRLFDYWSSEFQMEGLRFSILKKFNMTSEILGLPVHMKLLPIPMKELNYNPNIIQNPGY